MPCAPETPDAPVPTGENSGTRFTIAWSPPSEGGYEAFRISYYREEVGTPEDKTFAATVEGDVSVYTLQGLYVGTDYVFCVETLVGLEEDEDEGWVGDAVSDPYQTDGQTREYL